MNGRKLIINHKRVIFVAFLCLLAFGSIDINAKVKEYHQKSVAVKSGKAVNFVKNRSYFHLHKYNYGHSHGYYSSKTYQKYPQKLLFKSGNFKQNGKTDFYLPVSRRKSADMGNPQSITKSPDGHFAFIMYSNKVHGKNNGTSNIVRYDLWKLYKLKLNMNNMDAIRRGIKHNPKIRAAIKFGPKINVGHGQSLAYNPKNNTLWYILMGVNGHKATLVRASLKTFSPIKKIHFKFSSSYNLSNELTFDKHGNMYTYIKYLPNKRSAGRIVIFKGKILGNRVHFNVIKQGILNGPGFHTQGLGYNPKSNRLYFVSDGIISSIPIKKLGRLKPNDVHTTCFKTKREFEGIAFSKNGTGHILMNRGPELSKIINF
ncbi:hypothetical protein [Apilactobacillus quenuiae]|uniref:hypothetical protein n=1 Tax=Apilactobacillus quenuiae TaxID=2008377 RepID=UPI000D021135|nr:hypothetical protein [Apilactobacillus quenuiae]